MDAVTYPKSDVAHFIGNHLVPLRVNVTNDQIPPKFHFIWTPTVAIFTPKGNEVQRTIGFLGPEEFIAKMLLGIAKVRLGTEEYDTALIPLKSLMETLPGSKSVPEAIYFSGVAAYKNSRDPGKLKEAYEILLRKYPHNIWTERAYPYDLI